MDDSTTAHSHHGAAKTSDEVHEHVQQQLTNHDHRYTTGRKRLVTALTEAGRPLTLPDIVSLDPELAQSSAYRNLDVLEQCGVIHRMTASGDHTHFELAEQLLGHHHHLICVACGAIEDIHLDDALEELVDETLAQAARDAGYAPLHHTLDVYGRCPNCQNDA